jgi:hypothetical protein
MWLERLLFFHYVEYRETEFQGVGGGGGCNIILVTFQSFYENMKNLSDFVRLLRNFMSFILGGMIKTFHILQTGTSRMINLIFFVRDMRRRSSLIMGRSVRGG